MHIHLSCISSTHSITALGIAIDHHEHYQLLLRTCVFTNLCNLQCGNNTRNWKILAQVVLRVVLYPRGALELGQGCITSGSQADDSNSG